MTDEQLLLDVAKAEQEGVTSEHNQYTSLLIRRYMPMIKAKASCFKNSRVESDDLVSEGFLGLLSAIRSYNPEKGSFAAFASACISNKMRSAAAKGSANSLLATPLDESYLEEISDGNPATEDLIILKEQNNEMLKQVDELLSEREREVFYLYISAYSYTQIAEKLGISAKSVDNAITRAKAKLRNCFKDMEQ